MSDLDQQLRDAIRNLYLAQSELELIQRSSGYKIARRARRLFDFIFAPDGRLGLVNHALRRALNILLDEGPSMLCSRSVFKLGRVLRETLRIGTEGSLAEAASQRSELVRSIVSSADIKGPPFESVCRRSESEIAHLVGQHCQRCGNFNGSSCELIAAQGAESPTATFFNTLANSTEGCPIGAWNSAEFPPITRLNLVYHVTPIQHPENVWQWNVGELLKRIRHFNGRRIITVVTPAEGRTMDRPEAVVEAFAGHDVEFRFAPNDTHLREASHFISAMRDIASTDPSEAVFYAHCKGVSHLHQRAVRAWTGEMYRHNLDRVDEIRDLLRRWPCAGIAKRYGHFENLSLGRLRQKWSFQRRPWHGWHFAGTFWWVRHDKLFSQGDWDRLPLHRYAVEAYLANFFRSEEALCLAYDGIQNPYNLQIWQDAAA